ncbi:MAG: disulfide bond formation protein DsbA [Micavibrio sp.]|nr:disulfide bond formation protein DsbA [Micavibrio sp.]|tara:strand:- start:950 stop:1717 length:768 start_codon:yes stop_codon:yes gene_type:complete
MVGKKLKLTLLGSVAAALCLVGATASSQAQEFTFKDKAEFEQAVKDVILADPQVLFDAIELHRANETRDQQAKAAEKIEEYKEHFSRKEAPSVGAEDADITIVEFFDYNCGYCKRALPDIQAVVDEDDKVRVVFNEMAILGPTSQTAALWSLAAHKQGKYFEYHVALMEHKGPKTEEELMKLGESIGLDAEQLKKDAASEEVKAEFDKDMTVAQDVGVQGTPAFIVGTQFVPGYVPKNALMDIIKEERAKLANEG